MIDVAIIAASQVACLGGAAAALTPGPNLITNGTFDADTNWTKSTIGGGANATISGGVANFTAGSEGNQQRLTQALAGGSSPIGSYLATVTVSASSSLQVFLLGAASEARGNTVTYTAGTAVQKTIVATGEVSSVFLRGTGDCTADDFTLQLLS